MKTTQDLEVIGFQHLKESFEVKIELQLSDSPTYASVTIPFAHLSDVNENAGMYFNDTHYYQGEINEMLQEFINETEDYKIVKED